MWKDVGFFKVIGQVSPNVYSEECFNIVHEKNWLSICCRTFQDQGDGESFGEDGYELVDELVFDELLSQRCSLWRESGTCYYNTKLIL